MLRIKRIDIIEEKSELLYHAKFTQELLEKDFEIAGGEWTVRDGYLIGYMEEDGGGLIYSNRSFLGDVMIDFYGKTIAPYDNDLNFTFCSDGWNYEKNKPNDGYIGGLQGWWLGKTGIEKSPYDSNVEALTGMHRFEPGKEYHIQAGRVGERLFLFIDGELAVELTDNNPIVDYGRVGLGVYASKIAFRDLKVYKPYTQKFDTTYVEMRKEG
ncbi:MAG: hypothetical protein IJ514_02690 [Clostridia bacterium]|nr:hypothetical protein [Clostridia bacterium]